MAENNNIKIERIVDECGRRVETRIFETIIDGQKERVVETHVEQIPMTMAERVIETVTPIVTTRKKDTYLDGKVVDSLVEELEHQSLKMVQVGSSSSPDAPLTKQDLLDVLREFLAARQEETREVKPNKVIPNKEEKLTIEQEPNFISKIWNHSKWGEWIEIGLWVAISGELAYCVYSLILKNWL